MAISSWHLARPDRRVWRDLVSSKCGVARPARRVARITHCFYRNLLLGALRCSDQTAIGSTRIDPEFRHCQLHYFGVVVSPHPRLWQNRHAHSSRRGGEPDSDHFRCDLHHAGTRFVLRSDTGNRSRAGPNSPASLSRHRDGALRLDFSRTAYSLSTLERGCSVPRRIPGHAHQACRNCSNSRKNLTTQNSDTPFRSEILE